MPEVFASPSTCRPITLIECFVDSTLLAKWSIVRSKLSTTCVTKVLLINKRPNTKSKYSLNVDKSAGHLRGALLATLNGQRSSRTVDRITTMLMVGCLKQNGDMEARI